LALRQNIKSELAIMDKAKMSQRLSAEEDRREKKLLSDLDRIETAIKREFADVKLEEKKA